jgi:multidrug resistance efflux pump
MNLVINRLDPNVPDPVESRRRAAGRLVRLAYATIVFGVLAFIVVYFGRPLLYLGGPGVVTSARVTVSFPYVVHVSNMNVTSGSAVKAGDQIGLIWSPEHDNIVANYMRALADVASRSADLRIKARVAKETLEGSRTYQRMTEEAAKAVDTMSSASTTFRLEMFRERALAQKTVVSQEAELHEATAQLANLDEFTNQVSAHLDDVERIFAGGKVFAPVAGIIATTPARVGQSLMAGTPIAEIHDTTDVYVDWYIPNARFADPQVGKQVMVLFGNWRHSGTISQILPVSEVYVGAQGSVLRERIATQVARIRLSPGTEPPALGSSVSVHMYYSDLVARVAGLLVRVLGLG